MAIKPFAIIHDAKLDALEELIDELASQPLLVAYEFQSDLERIRERLGEDTPTLSGVSGERAGEIEARWNRGELPVLLVHPASAGHGLNLQGAGASHICWFSKPWDLEIYDQTVRRIYRQGSTSDRVINHSICVENSIDEIVEAALADKDVTQTKLLDSLNAEVLRDHPAPSPERALPKEDQMGLKKLGFKAPAPEPEAGQDTAAAPVTPKGWGAPAAAPEPTPEPAAPEAEAPARPKGWGPPGGSEIDEQRAEVQSKLQAPAPVEEEEVPPSVKALNAFPDSVVQTLTGQGAAPEAEAPAPTEPTWDSFGGRTRKAAEYFATPREAHAAGKTELVKGIDGFGAKSWTELDEVFGGEVQAPEPTPEPAPMPPTMDPVLTPEPMPTTATSGSAQHVPTQDYKVVGVAQGSGANPATLAALFETIAALLRGE